MTSWKQLRRKEKKEAKKRKEFQERFFKEHSEELSESKTSYKLDKMIVDNQTPPEEK